MYYQKPTYKKDTTNKNGGFVEGYKFKEVQTIDLTKETIPSRGENYVDISKEDRVIYVLDGLGYAKLAGKTVRLEKDVVVEIPAGLKFELNGQLKLLCIKARG